MPPRSGPQKSRNWCWTLNNYTEDDMKKIDDYHQAHPLVYIIYGREVGEGTEGVPDGTPHLQGFVHYKAPCAASATKKWLPRGHIQLCKGTPAENIAYCSKEDDHPMVYGAEPQTQQQANKAKQAKLLSYAKAGNVTGIQDEFPGQYLSQYRNINQIMTDNMVKPPDLIAPCGVWIYGETGCGKTTAARTEYGSYFSKPRNKWWDGYQPEQHECVVVDDLSPKHHMLAAHVKDWADKWSFTGEVKGGTRSLRPVKVIITSQYSIAEVFKEAGEEDIAAIERRFKVIHMHKDLHVPDYERL